MSHTRQEQMEAFGRFLDILDELRVKCPWDRKQTNESLRPNTIEETYELCDALMRDDKKEICKELGDVLLHVAFYAKIGSETGDFDIKDVCDKLCDKLIFRHPHVFGEVKADTAGQVSENWEQLKLKEKDGNKSVLSGVPAALPSLIKAYRIQDKARNVGFDWEEREQVWDKVKEEIGEFQEEVANMDKEKAEAEQQAKEQAEAEQQAKEKAEADRQAKEKAEAEKQAKEQAEAEKRAKEKAAQQEVSEETTYTVKPGDNLYRIALNHNLTTEQLKAMNGISGNDIRVGQKLKVK